MISGYHGQHVFVFERDATVGRRTVAPCLVSVAPIPPASDSSGDETRAIRGQTAKCQYMWRDIGRRATMYGLHVMLPAPYPVKNSAAANRVAIVGMREGWGPDFVRAAYRYWFQQGEESGSEPNLSSSLREIGQDPDRVLALAEATEANDLLLTETAAAKHLGIFGSPTFAVGNEIFWGDDRLEDAISWHKHGQV